MSNKSELSKIILDLTDGCGCICHLGTGIKTTCEHCSKEDSNKPESLRKIWKFTQLNEGETWTDEEKQITDFIAKIKAWAKRCVPKRYYCISQNSVRSESFMRELSNKIIDQTLSNIDKAE